NGDGNPDFDVVGIDLGLVLSGSFSGEFVSLVVDLATGIVVGGFDAIAPTDNSTLLLPALASDMGLSAANPRFAYAALAFDSSTGAVDVMPGLDAASGLLVEGAASFNAWTSSVSQGDLEALAAGASVTVPVSIDPAEWTFTPARGLMVVNIDDSN